MDLILPFQIGDFAEARSFVTGYNGAWFRCKVNDMRVTESGHLEYYLEYIDYTEEEKEWIEVFQENPRNPAGRKRKSSASSQIMLRPPFPQWYRGDQVPAVFSKSDVIASVYDNWKVGDLIDWKSGDCYWTAEITRLLDEDEVELELLKSPIGEGGSYRANREDLRPALDWSMVRGWTVPLSKANGKCWYAARLIHLKSDIEESNTDEEIASDDDGEEVRKSLRRASNTYEEALGSSDVTPSSDTNHISKVNNRTATVIAAMEKLRPRSTYKSSDSSHGTPGIKGATAEENRLSNGMSVRRYPLRARKIVENATRKQK